MVDSSNATKDQSVLLVFPHPQLGHILPTIRIAEQLGTIGYHVVYLTAGRFHPLLSGFGFECVELLDMTNIDGASALSSSLSYWYLFNRLSGTTRSAALARILKRATANRNVKCLLVDRIFVEAYRIDIPKILVRLPYIVFSTSLPNWDQPVKATPYPILFLCPEEFELEELRLRGEQFHYTECSLHGGTGGDAVLPRKGLKILATFGTQSVVHPRAGQYLEVLGQFSQENRGISITLSVGSSLITERQMANLRMSGVELVGFADQRAALKSCDLFITHGGLGAIKESIYSGTPMVVLPQLFDQPFNAFRVERNQLGVAVFDSELTAGRLAAAVEKVVLSELIKSNVKEWARLFEEKELRRESVEIILSYLEGVPT